MSDNAVTRSRDPIAETERIASLDTLRGVAVLGIFVMNSRNFALPLRQFDNPAFPQGPARPVEVWVWAIENLVFEDKMIAIFSMLFGAGMVVAAERALRPAWTHYKRMFWLLVIGLAHAFGLWYGDILNTYALSGILLYPLRKLKPGLVIGIGVAMLTVAVWARLAPAMNESLWPAPRESAALAAGAAAPSPEATESRGERVWREALAAEDAAYRGTWWELAVWRARLNEFWHVYGVIDFNFWRCGGFMLIGMGLMRLGVFSAARSSTVYWGMVLGGYGAGLALFAPGFWPLLGRALGHAPDMAPEARRMLGLGAWTMRYLAAAGIAIGHVGIVMLACRAPMLRSMLGPLAAVGRTALSNYLAQSVVAVIVFDGWAMAQWGRWRMPEIAMLVVAVWAVQLIVSPLWLRFWRFGPVEWAWRSATYAAVQPMTRHAPAPAVVR